MLCLKPLCSFKVKIINFWLELFGQVVGHFYILMFLVFYGISSRKSTRIYFFNQYNMVCDFFLIRSHVEAINTYFSKKWLIWRIGSVGDTHTNKGTGWFLDKLLLMCQSAKSSPNVLHTMIFQYQIGFCSLWEFYVSNLAFNWIPLKT